MRFPSPQLSCFAFRKGFFLLLSFELRKEFGTKSSDLGFDLVFGKIIVFKGDTKLHTSHFYSAFAFVFENRGVGFGVPGGIGGMGVGGGGFGERVVSGAEIGEVSLDVAVGTCASGCF